MAYGPISQLKVFTAWETTQEKFRRAPAVKQLVNTFRLCLLVCQTAGGLRRRCHKGKRWLRPSSLRGRQRVRYLVMVRLPRPQYNVLKLQLIGAVRKRLWSKQHCE